MAAKKKSVDFEAGLAAMEAIVAKLEGDCSLEEAMAAYEEGIRLHRTLKEALDASKKKLITLTGDERDEEDA